MIPLSLWCRWILCGILLSSSISIAAPEKSRIPEKRTASEELYLLSNDDVFSKMSVLLSDAHRDFITKQRGMNTFERQFLIAEQATSAMTVDAQSKISSSQQVISHEALKNSFDEKKQYLELIQGKINLIKKEKAALDKYAEQVKVMQLATSALEAVFDNLKAYHREINWRIEDGSLIASSIPDNLLEDSVLQLQKTITEKKGNIENKQTEVDRFFEALSVKVANSETLNEIAQHNYQVIEKEYNYSLRRKRLKDSFLAQPPNEFWAEGLKIRQELTWLDRVFEQSVNVFFNRYENFSDKRQHVTELLSDPSLKGSASLEPAEDGLTGIKNTLNQKATAIKQYRLVHQKFEQMDNSRQNLQLLIEELEADFAIVDEQLFKATTFLSVMAQREKTEKPTVNKKLFSGFSPKKIGTLKEKNLKLSMKIAASKKDLLENHKAINGTFQGLQADIKQIREQKKTLDAQYVIEKQLQDWNADIRSMTASDLVNTFEKVSTDLKNSEQSLQAFRDNVATTYQASQDSIKQFSKLEYPMLRQARYEMSSEQKNVFSSLALVANFDATDADIDQAMKRISSEPAAASQASSPDKEAETSPQQQLTAYEGLLSDRRTISDKRKAYRTELSANLTESIDHTKNHLALLEATDLLAKQRYAVSVELKRRVSLGEELGAQLPDKRVFRDSLKQDLFKELDEEKQQITRFHTLFSEQSILLESESTTEADNQVKVHFSSILKSVRKRLDSFNKLTSLQTAYSHQRSELSQIKQTEFNQAVAKKISHDMTSTEWLMNLIPSEEADGIHDILRTYYYEYIELQRKSKAITTQIETVESMLVSSEEEKEILHTLLAEMESSIAQHALEEERHWVTIKAQLLPNQASHLLSVFEKKTGESIETPTVITERKYKIAAIEQATQRIFLVQLQKRTLEKWIQVLNERLSSTGADYEAHMYQQRLSQLTSQKNGLERETMHIVGYNDPYFSQNPDFENTAMKDDSTFTEHGKIGSLKEEIFDLRKISVVWLSVKLLVIWMVVILLLKISKQLLGKSISDPKAKNPVLLALLDNFLVGIIWTIALIATLSVLGFNIGAIMAGLGIGGLALAMASKEALSDIIGGVSLMMAKSFKVGDFVIYEGRMITVKEIGLRYTTFRGGHNDHYLTVVPNSRLSEATILNVVGQTSNFRVEEEVALSITNSTEQINLAKELIKGICDAHPELNLAWVIHLKFENNAFILRVRFDVNILKLWPARNDLNIGIVEQFQQHGIAFADKPYFQVEKHEEMPLLPSEPVNG